VIPVVAHDVPTGPYKGLTPFEDSDRDAVLFFGREREREVIAANLLASRLTVLYGASGVGKSSVLRAGVAHHLRAMAKRNLETRGHPEFVVVVFGGWTEDPMAALLDAVQSELVDVFGPELAPSERAATPTDTLHDWTGRLDCDLLLVLDQTEEYFLYHEQEEGRGTLVGELPELVTRPGLRVSVLLAIRDDALARLDRFKGHIPNLFANYLRLDHLDKRAGRAAILGPIEQYNTLAQPEPRAAIEPELVEALLDETTTGRLSLGQRGRGVVRQSGARTRVEAPYLQLVLHRLWEEELAIGSSLMRLETLERLGGANEVVRTHLERALAEFPTEDKDVAADVFSHLVTPSGTKIAHGLHDLARYAHVEEARLEPIVTRLVHERILRPVAKRGNGSVNGRANTAPYEIFHDVLGEAVLDWRARYESERRVALERAESDRRHRRVLGILGVVVVALAAMTAIAAYAVAQRSEANKQAARARSAAATAIEQRAIAQKQTAKAEAASAVAEQEAENARIAEEEAEDQRHLAEEGQNEAERQKAAAESQKAEAETQKEIAVGARATAERAANAAVAATADANRQRRVAVSERATAVREKRVAEARLNLAEAQAQLTKDPMETLRLALKAVSLKALPEAEKVLRDGLLEQRTLAILTGGKGAVTAATFSPDGSRVATASESGEARIFRTSPAALLQRLPHDAPLTSIAFSPDSSLVATGGTDGTVRIWDLAQRGNVNGLAADRPVLRHEGRVRTVEFSPDGRLLLTASDDRTVRVWDVASGLQLRRFAHPRPVRSARFSPDGRLIVTAPVDRDPFARVFDVATGATAALEHPGAVVDARFTPDNTRVVSAGRRNIFVWQRGTWRRLHLLVAHVSAVHGVTVSPDSTRAVSYDDSGLGRMWRLDTGALIPGFIRHENSIDSAVFSADSATVVTASSDLTARIWTGGLSEFETSLVGHSEPVSSATFSPDGKQILTASDDGTARLWRTSTEPTLQMLGPAKHTGGATSIDTSADGSLVASGGVDGKVLLWRSRGGLLRAIDHGARVAVVALTADGSRLLSAGEDGLARLWRVRDGALLASVAHGAPIRAAALSADGRVIVTGGGTTARTWTSTGAAGHILRHDGAVTSLALSVDGGRIVTGSADDNARLWVVRTGEELRLLRGHTESIVSVAFSRDGARVATASTDTTARVWETSSGEFQVLEGHPEALTSIRFSPDGKRVVTASIDGQVRNWPVVGGQESVVFRGHGSLVADARFSLNGRWVVTSGPSAAGLFFAESGDRIYFLRGHGAPLTGALFTRGNRRILTAGTDGTVRTYVCGVCGSLPELRRLAKRSLASVARVP
jgi:WD40 repeat protein